jgi:hypothetical protein
MSRLNTWILFATAAISATSCDKRKGDAGSRHTELPPIFPQGPSATTNWNTNAGALMLVAAGNVDDSGAVVLPDLTDSTISELHGVTPPLTGVSLDLFGRAGKIESGSHLKVLSGVDTSEGCATWPAARLSPARPGWSTGFVAGKVTAIRLDSIETLSSVDSAALAASLTQNAAMLPVTSDPAFRGLPFRVRSAYPFRFDSVDAVVADIVRSVNEEANPRLEHLLLIVERPTGSSGKYSVVYYNRTAGAEETTQVTEVLAMILIGASRHPAAVINVEYNEGGRFGLLERTGDAHWETTWRSAYTGC